MLYYCGFDSFLQFKQEKGKNNVYLQPLSDLILDRDDNVILNAFIGWCSLFLQTGKGQILYLGYTKNRSTAHIEKNDLVVCSQVPKYIIDIECGAKETFLITLDLDLFKWSGFNFAKTFPTHISLDSASQATLQVTAVDDYENESLLAKNCEDDLSQVKIEQLCVGGEFSCLLTDTGKAYLFDIVNGKLLSLLSQHEIVSVFCGQEHILCLSADGRCFSWGKGTRGQLGHGNLDDILEGEAVSIEALEGIKCKAIAAGGWHSMVLSESGDVWVFGWNQAGQCGVSRDTQMMVLPYILEISEDDTFVAISAGSRHSMALNANGICFGFGWNFYNQLGLDPKNVFIDTPTVINVDEKVSSICCKFWSSLIETERENENEH